MKLTWESVRAFEAFLEQDSRISICFSTALLRLPCPCFSCFVNRYLQKGPYINITTGYPCCTKENVTAVAACAINTNTVLAAMGCRAVERDFATLVTVFRVGWPCRGVPTALKVRRDLAEGEGEEDQS